MPQVNEAVSIRFKAPRLSHVTRRNGERKLREIWQEQGIPPRQRNTTPMLFYGETLIVAAGAFVMHGGVVEDEEGVSLVWRGKQVR